VTVALAAWAIVGVMSEYRMRAAARAAAPPASASAPSTEAPRIGTVQPRLSEQETRALSTAKPSGTPTTATPTPPAPAPKEREAPPRVAANPEPKPPTSASPQLPHAVKSRWQDVTVDDIERDLIFNRLPPDGGIVTPIAPADEQPGEDVVEQYEYIREMLPSWQPGKVDDPVQRVRNLLYVAAVPDVQQAAIERFAPHAIYERLQQDIPKEQLIKILYWIALHPTEGDDSAVDQLWALHFTNADVDMQETRDRAAIYAVKLLGRLLGKIPAS